MWKIGKRIFLSYFSLVSWAFQYCASSQYPSVYSWGFHGIALRLLFFGTLFTILILIVAVIFAVIFGETGGEWKDGNDLVNAGIGVLLFLLSVGVGFGIIELGGKRAR